MSNVLLYVHLTKNRGSDDNFDSVMNRIWEHCRLSVGHVDRRNPWPCALVLGHCRLLLWSLCSVCCMSLPVDVTVTNDVPLPYSCQVLSLDMWRGAFWHVRLIYWPCKAGIMAYANVVSLAGLSVIISKLCILKKEVFKVLLAASVPFLIDLLQHYSRFGAQCHYWHHCLVDLSRSYTQVIETMVWCLDHWALAAREIVLFKLV